MDKESELIRRQMEETRTALAGNVRMLEQHVMASVQGAA